MFGGLMFPVSTTIGGFYWLLARYKYAEGYSTGDASKRYDHWSSKGIWTGLLWQLCTASSTAVAIALSK